MSILYLLPILLLYTTLPPGIRNECNLPQANQENTTVWIALRAIVRLRRTGRQGAVPTVRIIRISHFTPRILKTQEEYDIVLLGSVQAYQCGGIAERS